MDNLVSEKNIDLQVATPLIGLRGGDQILLTTKLN